MPLSGPIRDLRQALARADYTLSAEAYAALKALFLAALASPVPLRAQAPEYGKPERLLNVDASGAPVPLLAEVAGESHALLAEYPAFGEWMVSAPRGTLFPRWLCHLAGLRHRTVQLFIDHPTLPNHTLVQVRSLSKLQYPGCFDLPVAGHVVGLDEPAAALGKELAEELGLGPDDIEGLACLGADDRGAPDSAGGVCDCELSIVYRCRLRPQALARIHFADGEVAAICVFALPELQGVLARHPERIASGLRDSLDGYLRSGTP